MKLIIAGTRTFSDYDLLKRKIDQLSKKHKITEIVSGCAKGADTLGEIYAKENKITIVKMSANWDKFGKSAGYKRNEEMARYGESLVCFWDGESRGTRHMMNIGLNNKLNCWFIHYGNKKLKTPKVVNKNEENYDVYIGRGSYWGNPYEIKEHGREGAVKLFSSLNFPKNHYMALSGAKLGCFCKPESCHGDILVKNFKDYYND